MLSEGKTALITWDSRYFGWLAALILAREGADLVLNTHSS